MPRSCLFLLLCTILATTSARTTAQSYTEKSRVFFTAAEFAGQTGGRVRVHRSATWNTNPVGALTGTKTGVLLRPPGIKTTQPFARLPWNDITVTTQESANTLWFGTSRGAIRYQLDTKQYEYLAGQRWLPDDHVLGIGIERREAITYVWVETPKGFSRIEYNPQYTLAEKSKQFVARIRARHVRHGQTADSHLQTPGDLRSNQMVSSDNDGLWTAMYVAAECFRWKVTGAPDAREYAREGMRALMRLEQISGVSGFPARSFIKKGVDPQPGDGEWHDTPDGQWRWKGDTSSDEIVGHYFVWPIYYDLVADETEKQQLRALVDRVTLHLLNNNLQLIDLDGRRTRWGWWGPDTILEDPDETGLRALHILAHLRTAIYLAGANQNRARYQAAYDNLIVNHKYHLLMRNQKIMVPGHINHSDDELAFLSYYPLLTLEKDERLRAVYLESLERAWQIERPERNPLWNFIYAACSGASEFDKAESLLTLRQIPMDLISWTVRNGHRQDIEIDPLSDRFKRKQALRVLPYDELPMMKWNGNPYNLDGGNGGRSEDDGAYFLLPYWMGRYHRLIE
ncbi:MAG: hypothetical protein ACKV2V_08560 [Blastocatellia bacterium]